jgi:hypothetical protein
LHCEERDSYCFAVAASRHKYVVPAAGFEDRRQSKEVGLDHHLTKPVNHAKFRRSSRKLDMIDKSVGLACGLGRRPFDSRVHPLTPSSANVVKAQELHSRWMRE